MDPRFGLFELDSKDNVYRLGQFCLWRDGEYWRVGEEPKKACSLHCRSTAENIEEVSAQWSMGNEQLPIPIPGSGVHVEVATKEELAKASWVRRAAAAGSPCIQVKGAGADLAGQYNRSPGVWRAQRAVYIRSTPDKDLVYMWYDELAAAWMAGPVLLNRDTARMGLGPTLAPVPEEVTPCLMPTSYRIPNEVNRDPIAGIWPLESRHWDFHGRCYQYNSGGDASFGGN